MLPIGNSTSQSYITILMQTKQKRTLSCGNQQPTWYLMTGDNFKASNKEEIALVHRCKLDSTHLIRRKYQKL